MTDAQRIETLKPYRIRQQQLMINIHGVAPIIGGGGGIGWGGVPD